MSVGASAGAAAAIAAAAELMRQEEEEMSGYSEKDLSEGWEFKILRSNMSSFRKPERLQAVLDEEKRGGWTLVEKFDDCRIRLKRPAGTKVIQGDFADNYDPYRTQIAISSEKQRLIAIGAALALGAFFLLVTTALLVGG